MCSVYRPPSAKVDWVDSFAEEIDKSLADFDEIYIMGDINFDTKNGIISNKSWKQVTELNDLHQIITSCTRVTARSETLIDHVYATCPGHVVESFVPHLAVSDHYPVCFTRKTTKNQIKRGSHKSITYRCYKRFNDDSFLTELNDSLGRLNLKSTDVDKIFTDWNKIFLTVLDKHAPVKTKRVKKDTQPEWFNDEIKEAIKKRDAYESMSKFVKILVFSIFYENHLPDRDLYFFI